MIRPAAPQHSAFLEALIAALSRPRPPVSGRSDMKIKLPVLVRAFGALKATLALIGFAAVCGGLLLACQYDFSVPAFRQAAGEMFFPPAVEVAGPVQGSEAETPLEREQRAVGEYIAKRYRVSDTAVSGFVSAAYRAGSQYNVDPLLILAVMAGEARYNPGPESSVGAQGPMQGLPQFPPDQLGHHGGEPAPLGAAGTARPAFFSSGTMRSRRSANSLLRPSRIERLSGRNAASAACWAAEGAEMKRCCASFSNSRTCSSGSTTQPRRQPVMQKYFEKLLTTTTWPGRPSAAHGSAP